ncbi:MAG: spore germination protein [Clostridia bacterium]|nr:spore germination protein [Clostridia bacterium]
MRSPELLPPDSFEYAAAVLDRRFALPGNFGIIRRALCIGGMRALLYYAEALCDTAVTERVIAFSKESCAADTAAFPSAEDFCAACISYAETEISDDAALLHAQTMTGCLLLLTERFPGRGILIKARSVPSRSIGEPEHDKVLRGAHIGFVEVLPRNCAMIRRLLPTPSLIMRGYPIGDASQTNVVLCYLRGRADESYVAWLDKKLSSLQTDNLCLGTQSLAECLVRVRVWNPFPRFRYTERPDAAAASLCEGSVIVFVDGAPQAMILPVSLFAFLQESNDFYLAPFTGTYLRIVRLISFFLSVYLTPLWYALISHPIPLPQWLSFAAQTDSSSVPVLVQLLLIEIAVDMLKLASMNTPNALSNSLSVIGGLILGEFAIEVGWFMPESILYMAFVSITNFTQHNYELGYAFKFTRILMLVFTAVCGWWGLLLGTAVFVLLLVTVPVPEERRRYFYPLIPFDGTALGSLLIRRRKELP